MGHVEWRTQGLEEVGGEAELEQNLGELAVLLENEWES